MNESVLQVSSYNIDFWVDGVWYPAAIDMNFEVKAGKATKRIFQYVNLHPTSIGQKISVIVEHFRTHVMHMLGGQAKAMVVTDSRKAAVRYKIEFDKYLQRMGYQDFKA